MNKGEFRSFQPAVAVRGVVRKVDRRAVAAGFRGHRLAIVCTLALALSGPAAASAAGTVPAPCGANDTPDLARIHGRIQVVQSFPDYKVKVVESFADLHVQVVDSFPDKPGTWKMVDSFPDYRIQFVESFPDFTIRYVSSFPGVR